MKTFNTYTGHRTGGFPRLLPLPGCLLLLTLLLLPFWAATALAQAPEGFDYETHLEGNTLRGVVHVPRGMTVLVKQRRTYVEYDEIVLFEKVPEDFPLPTLDFTFDCTVTVDEHGLGEGHRYDTVEPAGYSVLSGGASAGYRQATGSLELSEGRSNGPRPASLYTDVKAVLAPHRVGWLPVPLCDWTLTARDNGDRNATRLEMWVNPDMDLLGDSVFHPPSKSFVAVMPERSLRGDRYPSLSKITWKKLSGTK